MGEEKVTIPKRHELQYFVKNILSDVRVLEMMLETDIFDTETIRIGAEQEICLIDKNGKPAMNNIQILEKANNPLFTSELAKFNLETNIEPLPFKGNCLSELEENLIQLLSEIKKTAGEFDTDIILTGILPTIRKFDLDIENLTPIPRYHSLMQALAKLRGASIELNITGIDELLFKHDSPMLEACNTGFQVHLQVAPGEFAAKYNVAQAIAGPALAVGTFSPLLFGKRLWAETRVALFQQSIDTRTSGEHFRDKSPRVMFGNRWLEKSIIEIYKEDISRFRVLLRNTEEEDSMAKWTDGITPQLKALQVHNGTVYRWNRPCYGVNNNVPHLRIENRVLPSGPTVTDEIANAAFWLGLMNKFDEHYPNITERLEFDDAKSNLFAAARNGLSNNFCWVDGTQIQSQELILKELLPIAKEGLEKANIDKKDISYYFDLLEERVKSAKTGSKWMLDSFNKLMKETTKDEAISTIVENIVQNQSSEKPVHKWPLAEINNFNTWNPEAFLVEEFMTTDLITVQKTDIIELVSEMMDFRRVRYVMVEDDKHNLQGCVSARSLLKWFNKKESTPNNEITTVDDVMIKNPITVAPTDTISEAIKIMDKERIGCLPVVEKSKLVGVITEYDFRKIASRLINRINNLKANT